jgi:hypothetical protein
MHRGVIVVACVTTAVLAGAAPGGATVDLTAIGTRIGDHPAFVRVVVDFTDGTINAPPVEATDPNPYGDGRVRVVVPGRNAQAQAPTIRREGVTARVLPGHDRVVIALSAAARRFKYAGYQVFRNPERLVIDLYKSRSPASGASARYGRPGCLGFKTITTRRRSVSVVGTEHGVFEHSFPSYVRSARGRILGRRTVTAINGRWRARVPYRVTDAQTGTVEAVELSAKDGALTCLAQAPVRLQS